MQKSKRKSKQRNSEVWSLNGFLMLLIVVMAWILAACFGFGWMGFGGEIDYSGNIEYPGWSHLFGALIAFFLLIVMSGFVVIGPNKSLVVQFFGEPRGTFRKQGFNWINPLLSKTGYSLKVNNFKTKELKINDKNGSPILVSAVFGWKVTDPEKAEYELDDYEEFFENQIEGNLRNVIRSYVYEAENDKDGVPTEKTLTHSVEDVAKEILDNINEDVKQFGIEAVSANLTNLAYAPEIAAAMTQRQQAKMTVLAKKDIVEGVTTVVESTIEQMEKSKSFTLTPEDKSNLAKNMTLLMCTGKEPETVVNIDR